MRSKKTVSTLALIALLIMNGGLAYKLRQTKKEVAETNSKAEFLLYEVARINEERRSELVGNPATDSDQTLDSFDYQWTNYNSGQFLPNDPKFMESLQDTICHYTKLPKEWFKGKKVIDIGAGSGRFTYGMLSMGAEVTAVEMSAGGCDQIRELCSPYKDQLTVVKANILEDSLPDGFDLVFCYGVAHHTGNTYMALKNACATAKPDAKLFFMVYGYPENKEDFDELVLYESLRQQLRNKSFGGKIEALQQRFPEPLVHGYFDAVSPRINELLRFEEMVEILKKFGVKEVVRTVDNRNIHVVGTKASA